tara:strand:+ start:882 stop:1418 length:537 start_codon:yes stop_codon:yes gene_type:complete
LDAKAAAMTQTLPFRISVLVFLQDKNNRFLLLQRKKSPNLGKWTPIGGKLEMAIGESPFECAIRETKEEAGMDIQTEDLHLFGMISEKSYEGSGHWLMFLFHCKKHLEQLPPAIPEGDFAFFKREDIEAIEIPDADREALWKVFDDHKDSFVAMRANCSPQKKPEVIVEQCLTQKKDG